MKTKEEIKQLAETEYGTEIGSIRGSNPYDLEADRKNGFIKGYNQCQEDMADKKYTEKDVINALHSVELKNNKDYSKIFEGMKDYFNVLNKKD